MTSTAGSQHVPRGGTARRRSGRRILHGALACLVLVAGFLSGLRPAQGEPDPERAPPPASDERRAAGPTKPVVEALCRLWETKGWKPLDAILRAPWPPSDRPVGTEPSLAAGYLATSVFGRVQDREDPRIRTVVDVLVQAALAADPPAQLRALWIFEDPCDRFWSVREGTWSPAPDGALRLHIAREDGKPARCHLTASRTVDGLTLLGHRYTRLGKDARSTPAR